MNIEEIIRQHSLAVRCLPYKVVSTYTYNNDELGPNEELIEINGRKFIRQTKILEKGGWWIVTQVKHSLSAVEFSLKKDFVAETLEEALTLFLNSKKDEQN